MYDASIKFFEEKEDAYETANDETEGTESESTMASDQEIEMVTNADKKSKPTASGPSNRGKGQKFIPSRKSFGQKPTVILLEEDDDGANQHSFNFPGFAPLKDFIKLKSSVEERWNIDLFSSASTKEDLDKIENEKNLNKIIFSGIEIHDYWAKNLTWANRIDKIKESIAKLIQIIDTTGT